MPKLYVLRHGQTDLNAQRRYNGRLDEDINATGIAQAEQARGEVEALDIDLIICSPLLRTRHTCDIINSRRKLPVTYDDRLQERDCGSLTGQPFGDFHDGAYWNYYADESIEGLEPVPALFDRVWGFLDDVRGSYPGKNILLVAHGGVARAIHFYFNEIPADGCLLHYGSDNCGIKEYDW